MEKFIEYCLRNTLVQEKERKDTHEIREHMKYELQQVEGGYMEYKRGEDG